MAGGVGYSLVEITDTRQESSLLTTHVRTRLSTWGRHTSNSGGTSSHRKKDLTCPLALFQHDLIKQIKKWQELGDKIILFMDHNEHVIKGPMGKDLGDRNGLDLREAIVQHTGTSLGATFFRGSKPIDGMWVSSNLGISNACVMPFGYGVGNHRAFILDVPLESLIGLDPVKIVRPVSRRLNSRIAGCCKTYI